MAQEAWGTLAFFILYRGPPDYTSFPWPRFRARRIDPAAAGMTWQELLHVTVRESIAAERTAAERAEQAES
eukprot:6112395-Alexandrium_andersonii.AAC.1